jgi:hypothetical protein
MEIISAFLYHSLVVLIDFDQVVLIDFDRWGTKLFVVDNKRMSSPCIT